MKPRPLLALGILAALAVPAEPETYQASIDSVHDGDTLYIDGKPQRAAWTDAPEGEQPYGPQARDALCAMVCGKVVRIETLGMDVYGRRPIVLIWVTLDRSGATVLVNAEMVRIGAAWVYHRDRRFPPPRWLDWLERDAREHGLGLWHGIEAPWVYRHEPADER